MKKEIKLVVDIEENDKGVQELIYKNYSFPIFVKGGILKEAIKLGVKLDDMESKPETAEGMIDDLAIFVSELYGNKFTPQELIDGTDATKLMDTLTSRLSMVFGEEEQNEKEKKFLTEKNS